MKKFVGARIDRSLWIQMRAVAQAHGCTVVEFLEAALRAHITRYIVADHRAEGKSRETVTAV